MFFIIKDRQKMRRLMCGDWSCTVDNNNNAVDNTTTHGNVIRGNGNVTSGNTNGVAVVVRDGGNNESMTVIQQQIEEVAKLNTEIQASKLENQQFKTENQQFKTENEQFKTENKQFETENQQFKTDVKVITEMFEASKLEFEASKLEFEASKLENQEFVNKLNTKVDVLKEHMSDERRDWNQKVDVLKEHMSDERRDWNQKVKDLSDRVLYLESSLRENSATSKVILEHCQVLRLEIDKLVDIREKEKYSLLEKVDIIIDKTCDITSATIAASSEEFD